MFFLVYTALIVAEIWVRNLIGLYAAGELVQFEQFQQVKRVLEAFVARPAVARGLTIPARD